MNWECFATVICGILLVGFMAFYEGVDRGIKAERGRILDRYDIKMK